MITVYQNPRQSDMQDFLHKYTLADVAITERIEDENLRIDFINRQNYVFFIAHLAEYRQNSRTVDSVELNVYFDKHTQDIVIFAHDTQYFFQKYKEKIFTLPTNSINTFVQSFLEIVLTDESRIIDHILYDTQQIRKEHVRILEGSLMIRHLTNNLINISTLELIFDNQNKLLALAEQYIRAEEKKEVQYQRAYIKDELVYAKEFCRTLIESLNTKYQVKMSDDLYQYTRYTYVFFLAGVILQAASFWTEDTSPLRLMFWLCAALTFLGTSLMFRRF